MPMILSAEHQEFLQRVNTEVNKLPYQTDIKQYFKDDFWSNLDSGKGDCEDFSIEKRKRLMAAGWDWQDLRLAVCLTDENLGHAVLTVDAIVAGKEGTWVLDNNSNTVLPWDKTSYTWLLRQGPDGQLAWVTIG